MTQKNSEQGNDNEFRSKMFEMIQKTNERVQLDRPFLIREKMQVIMVDSEQVKDHNPDIYAQQKEFVRRHASESMRKNRRTLRNNSLDTMKRHHSKGIKLATKAVNSVESSLNTTTKTSRDELTD